MRKIVLATAIILLSFTASLAQQKRSIVEFKTTKGKILIELYNETPIHRDNFLKLVKEHAYDGVLFHRVINQFMVQTGNLETKNAVKGQDLSEDSSTCKLPAEFRFPTLFHVYGAVAAAREGDEVNPQKESSCSQFYIVTGKFFTDMDLDRVEENYHIKYPKEVREAYKLQGGTPHLDNNYTVFGHVIKGMNVVEKIQSIKTNDQNAPLKPIVIKSARIIEE
ncbi:peptidylprolyl isomerase [Falsiporphyromonas endometrii]|uniref:peptidylprolyl isomerase n=1 Tax=Falsiporphyromonas endometrii TaxID=1387297 RepID=A0ABV9K7F0_9PORP